MSSDALTQGMSLQGGKYCIVKVLGQGGFGITYLAEQKMLGRTFAIKEFFMRDFCARDEKSAVYTLTQADMVDRYRQKFIKEARLIAHQNHSGIVKVSDIFNENGTVYYVMDYLEGESLEDIVKKEGAFSEQNALDYILKVAEALDYLHKSHVNHLDIKPSNIMVRRDDNMPILIDFGVSKQYDKHRDETSTTPPGVSRGYSPIEQYQSGGVSTFSPQADIYALGATLYKLLTGETPPDASIVLNKGIPPLRNSISVSVRNAIENAMKPQVDKRPKSMRDFINLLGKSKSGHKGKKGFLDWLRKGKRTVSEDTILLPPINNKQHKDSAPQRHSWKWWLIGGISFIGTIIFLMSLFPLCDDLLVLSTTNEEVIASDSVETQWQVIECKDLSMFHEGLAKVQDGNGKYGFIDKNGKVVISCEWKRASFFSEGLASVVDDNGKYGFIDKTGDLVIPCSWKDAWSFSEGLARAKDENDRRGFIDKSGQVVIPCSWKDAWSFSEGLANVQDDNGKYGFIDKTGDLVIPCSWKDAWSFSEGLAKVQDGNGKYGFIDKNGKVVIPFKWESVISFSEGLASVEDDHGNYYLITKTGEIVNIKVRVNTHQ